MAKTLELDDKVLRSWRQKSARIGVLEVYDFGRIAHSCGSDKILGQCPSIRAKVDLQKLKATFRVFDDALPRYVAARHGATHVGDKLGTTDQFDKHSSSDLSVLGLIGGDGKNMLSGLMTGDTYSNSWEGKTFSLEISKATLQILENTTIGIYDAYGFFISNLEEILNPPP